MRLMNSFHHDKIIIVMSLELLPIVRLSVFRYKFSSSESYFAFNLQTMSRHDVFNRIQHCLVLYVGVTSFSRHVVGLYNSVFYLK